MLYEVITNMDSGMMQKKQEMMSNKQEMMEQKQEMMQNNQGMMNMDSGMMQKKHVITSYSIHYTKLYDFSQVHSLELIGLYSAILILISLFTDIFVLPVMLLFIDRFQGTR